MKKPRVKRIKVRYISSSERKAEQEMDRFLQRVNAGRSFDALAELARLSS